MTIGSELRLGRRETYRANILNGIGGKDDGKKEAIDSARTAKYVEFELTHVGS